MANHTCHDRNNKRNNYIFQAMHLPSVPGIGGGNIGIITHESVSFYMFWHSLLRRRQPAISRTVTGDIRITSSYSFRFVSLLLSILSFRTAMYFISHSGTGAPMRPAFSVIDKASFNKYHTVVRRDSIADGK